MKFKRFYTQKEWDSPYEGMKFESRKSEIKDPDGSLVFSMDGVVVPASWTQVSTDVIAQKYFRKAGVPQKPKEVKEKGVPEWLQRSEEIGRATCRDRASGAVLAWTVAGED